MAARRPTSAENLAAYASTQRAADAEILRVLRDAYADSSRELAALAQSGRSSGSAVRRDQIRAVQKSLLERQAEIFRRTGDVIERKRVEAAAKAIQVAGRYDEAAFSAVGREDAARALARGLEETELRTVDAAVARMTGSHTPLSSRVYRTQAFTDGMLERRINSGLARGLSAEAMARELREFVNPNTPGGTRFAALRLARTEINNAFHAMSIQAARLKPWIDKMEWRKSASHKVPDICDTLDGQTFAVDEVPKKPHPQCLCVAIPVVGADDEAFLNALAGGEFDAFLNQFADQHGVPDSAPPATVTPIRPAKKAARKAAAPRQRARAEALGQFDGISGQRAFDAACTDFEESLINSSDIEILAKYQMGDFESLNEVLRSGRPLSDAQKKMVARLDAALGRVRLSHDTVTHRVLLDPDGSIFGGLQAGSTFTDLGYASTTTHTGVVDDIIDEVFQGEAGITRIQFEIPEGTPVGVIHPDITEMNADRGAVEQHEIILGRLPGEYQVVSVTEDDDGNKIIRMRVLSTEREVRKAAPVKKAVPVPATAAGRTHSQRLGQVPASEEAARLTSDPTLRAELDLQAAITPNSIGQLFTVETVDSLGAGSGADHNRSLRRIRVATGISDGLTGRDIYRRSERSGYHPVCGSEHSSAQIHLAHEYGHHVHHMLDFMPLEDRLDLRDLVADVMGVDRPGRAKSDDLATIHASRMTKWMTQNRSAVRRVVGEYATTNEREMLAEIWSAYSTNPDASEAIKKIGARMQELAEQGAIRGQIDDPAADAARIKAIEEKIRKAMQEGRL